jgi:hypothetical protein
MRKTFPKQSPKSNGTGKFYQFFCFCYLVAVSLAKDGT